MKKILLISVMFMLILPACKHTVDYSPREVNYDRDICAQCLMGIAEQPWAVQAINSHGEVLWFDDIGCLNEYMKGENWKKFTEGKKVQIWVGDSQHEGKWLDARKAYYTFGQHTPMGYGYSAVAEKGDSTYTFDEVLKRIDEGKTMREEFLKKHKMMGKGKGHMH
jgi:copper chaperone NosL